MLSQIALPEPDRQTGATIAIFAQTLGATIFVSASQSIYQNKLKNGIELIEGLDIQQVLKTGVSGFRQSVPVEFLPQVVEVAVKVSHDLKNYTRKTFELTKSLLLVAQICFYVSCYFNRYRFLFSSRC